MILQYIQGTFKSNYKLVKELHLEEIYKNFLKTDVCHIFLAEALQIFKVTQKLRLNLSHFSTQFLSYRRYQPIERPFHLYFHSRGNPFIFFRKCEVRFANSWLRRRFGDYPPLARVYVKDWDLLDRSEPHKHYDGGFNFC